MLRRSHRVLIRMLCVLILGHPVFNPVIEAQELPAATAISADSPENVVPVVSAGDHDTPVDLINETTLKARSSAFRGRERLALPNGGDVDWISIAALIRHFLNGCLLLLIVGMVFSPRNGFAGPPVETGFSRPRRSTADNFRNTFVRPVSYWMGESESATSFAEHHEPQTRYSTQGNGWIPIAEVHDYPRIPALDVDDEENLWATYRPNLFGQEVEDEWDFYNLINTDRPDFTDATFTVGKGVTIWESGYTFRSIHDHEANNRLTRRSVPEVLMRHGITDELEIRVKWNGYLMTDLADATPGKREQLFGNDDLTLGAKYEIWQQEGWRPMLTTLFGSTVPNGTNGYSANTPQPFLNFVGGWGIRRWLYFKTSAGIDWQRSTTPLLEGGPIPGTSQITVDRDNLHLYHLSGSLLFQATKRVGGFAELFCLTATQSADNRPANYFDTGLYFYITPNVQLDVRYGTRLSDRVTEYFTGTGFSLRY